MVLLGALLIQGFEFLLFILQNLLAEWQPCKVSDCHKNNYIKAF